MKIKPISIHVRIAAVSGHPMLKIRPHVKYKYAKLVPTAYFYINNLINFTSVILYNRYRQFGL